MYLVHIPKNWLNSKSLVLHKNIYLVEHAEVFVGAYMPWKIKLAAAWAEIHILKVR